MFRKLAGLFSQYRGLRREIYVLFIGRIVTGMGSMVWPMLTMILSGKLGMSAQDIAELMIAAGLVLLPANLVGGKLADRYNKKNVIVICDFISVSCYIAAGFVPLGPATIVLILIAAILQSMEHPSYSALFADMSSTRDRQRAFSLSYLGVNLGLVLSPTIAGLLFKDHLDLIFIISGAAIGVSTLLILLFVHDISKEPDDGEEAVYQQEQKAGIFTVLKENRILLLYILIVSVYGAAYGQYGYIMPLDMGRVHGDSGALIFGTISSLNCIVVVLFTPLFTKLFRRVSELKKLLAGQALVGAGYLLFLLLLGHIPAYYMAMLLFTWGEILATLADGPYLTKRIPASHRGRVTGVISVVSAVCAGAIELSVGRLYDNVGSSAAWMLIISLLAASALLTVVLLLLDKKRYPKLYEHGSFETEPPPERSDCDD